MSAYSTPAELALNEARREVRWWARACEFWRETIKRDVRSGEWLIHKTSPLDALENAELGLWEAVWAVGQAEGRV